MERVLVTGARGLFGSTLAPALRQYGYEVVCHSRGADANVAADLSDREQTEALLDRVRPQVIVNLAATTNVDQCEREPHAAYVGNVLTVENLAGWIRSAKHDCYLIQLSTDHLYDGPGPHSETDVHLSNLYAFSKYAGELVATSVPSTVLRTNFFGRSLTQGRCSFSDWIVDALRKKECIRVFEDVVFSPLSMDTLATCIAQVIERRQRGVFNLGCHNGMSKADFAFALAAALDLPSELLTRTHVVNAELAAYRPKDMRMDCRRFEHSFGISLPNLTQEIDLMKRHYQ